MTQRTNHSPIAIAKPQGSIDAVRAAMIVLAVLITVLVLITGPVSAEYGFA